MTCSRESAFHSGWTRRGVANTAQAFSCDLDLSRRRVTIAFGPRGVMVCTSELPGPSASSRSTRMSSGLAGQSQFPIGSGIEAFRASLTSDLCRRFIEM